MFIPLIPRTARSDRLERRKGGGGGGRSSGGSSSTGKSSGSSSEDGSGSSSTGKSGSSSTSPSKSGSGSSSTGSKTSTGSGSSTSSSGGTSAVPLIISTGGGESSALAYGLGGGSTILIPAGQMFAGRSAGGGLRSQIYGSRTYGSGYPDITGRGVSGRGFPFWFWPIVWAGFGVPAGSYLEASEYGDPYNTSRVGGPMVEATFASNSTNTTFHVLSDNTTVSSLISSIDANCSSYLSSSSSTSPQIYNGSAPWAPQPEQAIQYYRASSIVLTLDGYNNSATLSSNPNATDSPLPSGIDTTLLDCLNQTIALSAPLVSSASMQLSIGPSSAPFLGMLWLVWWIFLL